MNYYIISIKILPFFCFLILGFESIKTTGYNSTQEKVDSIIYTDTVFENKRIEAFLTQSNYIKIIVSDKNRTFIDSTEYFPCLKGFPIDENKSILSYDGMKTEKCNFLYCGDNLYAISIYNDVSSGILCFAYTNNKIKIIKTKDADNNGFIGTRGRYVFFDTKNKAVMTKGHPFESKKGYYGYVALFKIENSQYIYVKEKKDLTDSEIDKKYKNDEVGESLYIYKKYFNK